MSEITRTEKFLRACIDGEPCKLKPLTRMEKLLAELNDKLAGGPSEVVILPETVFEPMPDEEGMFTSTTPHSATPTEGAAAKVTYNGTEYSCTVAYFAEMNIFLLGNIDQAGAPVAGGNPDAPFVVMLMPGGQEGVYTTCIAMDGATTVTISIVQTEGAASGGESAGGGVVVATAIIADDGTVTSIDKTYAELLTAFDAGKPVQMIVKSSMADFMMPLIVHLKLGGDYLLFSTYTDTKNLTLKASLRYNADGTAVYAST